MVDVDDLERSAVTAVDRSGLPFAVLHLGDHPIAQVPRLVAEVHPPYERVGVRGKRRGGDEHCAGRRGEQNRTRAEDDSPIPWRHELILTPVRGLVAHVV